MQNIYLNKELYISKDIVYKGKYFNIYITIIKNRKTPIYEIYDINDNNIGQIKWFAHWRKFCFYPYGETIWDDKCLQELNDIMVKYNQKWKSKK